MLPGAHGGGQGREDPRAYKPTATTPHHPGAGAQPGDSHSGRCSEPGVTTGLSTHRAGTQRLPYEARGEGPHRLVHPVVPPA